MVHRTTASASAPIGHQTSRPPQYLQGRREALKWAVTWLYVRSESMNDPHAKAILNAAAYNMGEDVKDGKFPKVKRTVIDKLGHLKRDLANRSVTG